MDDHPRTRRVGRTLRAHLTTANAIAFTALFVALGGGAYAATTSFVGPHGNINSCVPPNGGEVNVWKPGHSCSGGRVALAFPAEAGAHGATGATGVTGATGTTGATGATNPAATTVDGESVTKLTLKVPTPTSASTQASLYSGDGLTIDAACNSSGNASLLASGPASADSELTVSGYQSGASPASFGSQTTTLGTTPVTIAPATAGEASFSYQNSAGQVITGEVGYEAGTVGGNCTFYGTATAG